MNQQIGCTSISLSFLSPLADQMYLEDGKRKQELRILETEWPLAMKCLLLLHQSSFSLSISGLTSWTRR